MPRNVVISLNKKLYSHCFSLPSCIIRTWVNSHPNGCLMSTWNTVIVSVISRGVPIIRSVIGYIGFLLHIGNGSVTCINRQQIQIYKTLFMGTCVYVMSTIVVVCVCVFAVCACV